MVGYTYIVIGELAVALIGFGVWMHHMFVVGLPNLTNSFISLGGDEQRSRHAEQPGGLGDAPSGS